VRPAEVEGREAWRRTRDEVERLFRRYGKGVGSYLLTRVGDPSWPKRSPRVFLTVATALGARLGGGVALGGRAANCAALPRTATHRPRPTTCPITPPHPTRPAAPRGSRTPHPPLTACPSPSSGWCISSSLACATWTSPRRGADPVERRRRAAPHLKQLRAWLEPPLTGPVRRDRDERTTQ
jgi:hypothetical protein